MENVALILKEIRYIIFAIILGLGINIALAQWTGPTQNPPGGNFTSPAVRVGDGIGIQTMKDNLVVNENNTKQVGLYVGGEVMKIPSSTTGITCNSGTAGLIRLNASAFQGCNGTTWVSF